MTNHTHHTTLGVTMQPRCTDACGYIKYRPGVIRRLKAGEDVPAAWPGERWIADQEANIERRRG